MTDATHHHHVHTLRAVFRMPLILGVATIVGLTSALIGDDAWDVLSWLALLCPLAAVAVAWKRRNTTTKVPS